VSCGLGSVGGWANSENLSAVKRSAHEPEQIFDNQKQRAATAELA